MATRESPTPPALTEQRDTHASVFATLLRQVLVASDAVRAAVYVDGEGECIDYCCRVMPDDARLLGAQLVALSATMPRFIDARSPMAPGSFVLRGDNGAFYFHRVADGCALVIATEPTMLFSVRAVVRDVVHALARETQQPTLPAETLVPLAHVEVRQRGLGERVPAAFEHAGARHRVGRVVGRWCELDRTSFPRMLWRIATQDDREVVLAHVVTTDRWYLVSGTA